jgi:hypothetical protein
MGRGMILNGSGQLERRIMSLLKCTAWKEDDVSVKVDSWEGG